jgi:hypothetical protein
MHHFGAFAEDGIHRNIAVGSQAQIYVGAAAIRGIDILGELHAFAAN